MARFADRLEKLERLHGEDAAPILIVTVDGKPDEVALQEAVKRRGLTVRPRHPIFLSPIDAEL